MNDHTSAQTPGKRKIVVSLDRQFARLHKELCALVENTPGEVLYRLPGWSASGLQAAGARQLSIGESILRSAAAVERAFGGITANLWDDPFEWTLPEYLSTPARILGHLTEVEATRKQAFISFADDGCLSKDIAMPSGDAQQLFDLLLETLLEAAAYQARAAAIKKMLSDNSPPGFII